MDTAGRAVWVSGMTVAVSLLVLVWVPVPLLRSVALGGVLAVCTALLGALVLLPALLAWLGPRVNRLAVARTDVAGPSPFWRRVGGLSMRHPVATALLCSAALLALASPVLRMRSAVPDARMFGRESEVRRVEDAIGDTALFDPSGASSLQILLETKGALLAPESLRAVHAYLDRLAARRASRCCARRCSSSTRAARRRGAGAAGREPAPRAGARAQRARRSRAGGRGGRPPLAQRGGRADRRSGARAAAPRPAA